MLAFTKRTIWPKLKPRMMGKIILKFIQMNELDVSILIEDEFVMYAIPLYQKRMIYSLLATKPLFVARLSSERILKALDDLYAGKHMTNFKKIMGLLEKQECEECFSYQIVPVQMGKETVHFLKEDEVFNPENKRMVYRELPYIRAHDGAVRKLYHPVRITDAATRAVSKLRRPVWKFKSSIHPF
jgi:hypothetical protein